MLAVIILTRRFYRRIIPLKDTYGISNKETRVPLGAVRYGSTLCSNAS